MRISKAKKSKKKFFVAVAIVALAAFGWGVYAYTQEAWPFNTQVADTTKNKQASEEPTVNYEPPTEQDIEESQTAKERILEGSDQENSDSQPVTNEDQEPAAKKRVAVNVSYADIFENNLEVRAFIPSVIQGAGTCTVTASKTGSNTVTHTSSAFVDASSTICEPIYIPRSKLPSGTWSVEVKFSSPTHQGSSGRIEVEV